MTERHTALMPDIVYRRNLPHIHPDGSPLFITFRVAESLPLEVLVNRKKERESELSLSPDTSEINNIELNIKE